MTRDERFLLEEKYGGVATPEFERDVARIHLGEPVAYVIGHQPFLGLTIPLDSHPLIPRPETEWWSERFLEKIKNVNASGTFAFLDLCAGSGAIGAAALARLPNARVSFGEINPAHESTIRKTIAENNLDAARADIRIGDLFAPFGKEQFDFIAANPPYIPEGRVLPESVHAHEPAEALFSGADGLTLIRHIAKALPTHLAVGGEAWIECDSPHAAAACGLFAAEGFVCTVMNDQYDAPRVLVVSWK